MSARIFVSHSIEDDELGSHLVALSRALIDGVEVDSSAAPEAAPLTRGDEGRGLDQRLRAADAVIAVAGAGQPLAPQLAFEVGAAFALGRPLYCVSQQGAEALGRLLPEGRAQLTALAPEALLELFSSLAARVGLRAEVGGAARAVLSEMFPEFRGLDRESSERPVAERNSGTTQQIWPIEDGVAPEAAAPAPVAEPVLAPRASTPPAPAATSVAPASGVRPSVRPAPVSAPPAPPQPRNLPSCAASLEAGRAMADCVWNRQSGSALADELDVPFGSFLAALGSNWSMLRELNDVDVWLESADNVLGSLAATERHVHRWYEIGFQLAMLASMARAELEGELASSPEQDELWQTTWASLQRAAHDAGVRTDAIEELHAMLENLRGPSRDRDYANLGRSQQRVRELASAQDQGSVSASA